MVDGINAKPAGAGDLRVASVARPQTATPSAPVGPQPERAAPQIAALARSVAAAPPVDAERVERIKAAIANGTFPILPATIADQLMAFRYEWMSHDQA